MPTGLVSEWEVRPSHEANHAPSLAWHPAWAPSPVPLVPLLERDEVDSGQRAEKGGLDLGHISLHSSGSKAGNTKGILEGPSL